MRSVMKSGLLAVGLVAATAGWAGAQVAVTSADIQRLQDQAFAASSDVAQLRQRDTKLAGELERELDLLREEVIYLKVKIRKEGAVTRSEYTNLRDRLEALRAQARGGPAATSGAPAGPVAEAPSNTVPVGTELDVRLQTALDSGTAQVEDRFEATTAVDLVRAGRVLIPAGSVMRGVVTGVDRASRTDRKGSLTVSCDQITINGRAYPMRGTVTQALESEGIRGEAGRIGTGAGVGAIIGGILGGFKGALAGILIGGGGVIAATPGQDVNLPPGTILRVRLDTPLTVK